MTGTNVTDEQRELARGWLRRLGREVTPAAVEELAPHVKLTGRPDNLEYRAFARLVRSGQVPTQAAVQGERQMLTAHLARVDLQKGVRRAVEQEADVVGPSVATAVQAYRDEHGSGPGWSELRRLYGWPSRGVTSALLRGLRAAGWLEFDEAPGSLRPGPAWKPPPPGTG